MKEYVKVGAESYTFRRQEYDTIDRLIIHAPYLQHR